MKKPKRYRLVHDIKRVLRDPSIGVAFSRLKRRGTRGEWWPMGIMLIDPNEELLPTVVHECLHASHPTWSEQKVRGMENELMNQMSFLQMRNIMKDFSNKVVGFSIKS